MSGFTISLVAKGDGATLDRIYDALVREAETIACAGALPIANYAKIIVRKKTGTLARSIHIGGHADLTPDTRLNADLFEYGEIAMPERSATGAAVFVGTNLNYAPMIEFGGAGRISAAAKVALHKYGGGAVTGNFRPAYPFLRPAFESGAVREESREAVVLSAQIITQHALAGGA
jgi:hypothetical protein